ncbi:uncharacterized protein [Solanum tuberosum]|uniref:uncharacterized protein isoform X3 n=1 Tax=Solanum tuberosum TaxID=4113 RepID=UPI00073A01B7|nr:PREDICTED: uncharacterized protein LOC102579760 isoform X3 [Solanum tuberosum]
MQVLLMEFDGHLYQLSVRLDTWIFYIHISSLDHGTLYNQEQIRDIDDYETLKRLELPCLTSWLKGNKKENEGETRAEGLCNFMTTLNYL